MKIHRNLFIVSIFVFFLCAAGLRGFEKLPSSPKWQLIKKIQTQFDTFHPQGLVKIGDSFYLSAVEKLKKTEKLKSPPARYDRTPGEGVGYLFQFDGRGRLVRKMTLGEGTIYHPGGIDYDGKNLWVPVAEYRPHSASIIYKVDPTTWKAVEAFRVQDHIGGLVYDRESKTLVGLNWDSKNFYEWTLDGHLIRKVPNESQELAYQDCKYFKKASMLCSGVRDDTRGGMELVDLKNFKKIHGIYSAPRTAKKILMTKNPMAVESSKDGLRYYFLPEDRASFLYIFEID